MHGVVMVDFARVQNRIYYGYGKAAVRLGTELAIYRSADGQNPIQMGNFLFNQLVGIDQDYKYMKGRKYGDMTWQFLPENGLLLQNYDYMVGSQFTYFIADVIPDGRLNPPLCVECNAIITINELSNTKTAGSNPYQQYVQKPILVNCPVSILAYTRMDGDNMKLPTSVKNPTYNITAPNFDDVIIKTGYEIDDDKGRRLVVISAETTKHSLGLRILAQEKSV
jgi:hypothetical protein